MRYQALSQNPNLRQTAADITGFEVRSAAEDEKLGKIADMIMTGTEPRYIDVQFGGFFNERHALLPIGVVEIDPHEQVVWVSGLTKDELKSLPEYGGNPAVIDERFESRVRDAYAARIPANELFVRRGADWKGDREARITRSKEELAAGQQHVREPVTRRSEEIDVEGRGEARRPDR